MSSFQPSGLEDSVLVVDDDQSTRDSLAAVLTNAGIHVYVAGDSDEAVSLQGLHHPAAVVVDYLLPDHTGIELAERLKELDPETPVLLLTELGSLDSALSAAGGLDGLLVKPLVPQAFVQTVRNALAHRRLVVENRRLVDRIERLSTQEPTAPPLAPLAEQLTEMPNRTLLEDRLEKALAACQRDYSSLAVLYVDLDGWQAVQEQAGQGVADQVLREVADRLTVARRKSDVVARIGTDKFALVCSGVQSSADAFRIAALVREGVAPPVAVDGVEHWLRATVGIVVTDSGAAGETASSALENAELAMHFARDEGRASRQYDKSMRDRVSSRYEIQHGLQQAIDGGELVVFYQPVVNLQTGQVVAAEALVRWRRPDAGLLLPGDFLGVAEEVGLSSAIGRWVLDRGLADVAAWKAAGSLPAQFRLVVNVSARELTDAGFADTLEELTAKHGISPGMLSLDLTEQAARQVANADDVLDRLNDLGVSFSLDDFGAGESKLSWLQDLPVTALKIAPQFVAALDVADDPYGAAMVRALIALGHELHLSMIGEGVETPAQAAALRAMGCELAQGYHLGHPQPAEEVWAKSA